MLSGAIPSSLSQFSVSSPSMAHDSASEKGYLSGAGRSAMEIQLTTT